MSSSPPAMPWPWPWSGGTCGARATPEGSFLPARQDSEAPSGKERGEHGQRQLDIRLLAHFTGRIVKRD
ncbi:hypothetical protein G6F24_018864 [Rhizopus arrhizus]|nr:hypothetical protein G6F24_018864 [Rhizopus arrhizus]